MPSKPSVPSSASSSGARSLLTNERQKRATLYDVAAQAGVSSQTVSRVINNSVRVSNKTRSEVLRVIKELDYQPNIAARSLKTQRSRLLQVIVFETYYPAEVLYGMLDRARSLGYKLQLTLVATDSRRELQEALDEATKRLIDGILIIAATFDVPYDELYHMARGIPLTLIDTPLGAQAPSVALDQRLGCQLATQHLIDLGHTRIAEICGKLDMNIDARERHESWLATLARNGLSPAIWFESGQWGFGYDEGYQSALRLLDSGVEFTALIAGNDAVALGAMRAFEERGVRVPDDISVVGFDDMWVSSFAHPPLTTIRQDFRTIGAQAVEYLVDLIEKPGTPIQQRVLYPELIVRQSTRRLP